MVEIAGWHKCKLVFPNGQGNLEAHANMDHRGLAPAQIAAGVVVGTGDANDRGEPIAKAKYGFHALRPFFASWIIQPREEGGLGYANKRAREVRAHATIALTMDTHRHLFPREESGWQAMERAERSVFSM